MNKPVKHLMKYVFRQEVKKAIPTPPEKVHVEGKKNFFFYHFFAHETNPCAGLIS